MTSDENSGAPRTAIPGAPETNPHQQDQEGSSIMSNNPYPVDSATRTCCGGIDKHAADCDPQIPLPVGATSDGWTSIRAYDGCPVRALVWWHRDLGRISVSIDG